MVVFKLFREGRSQKEKTLMMNETSIPMDEVSRCLLCNNATCTKACSHGLDPAKIIRSLRFDNTYGACMKLKEKFSCATCSAPCENACVQKTNQYT